MTSWRLQNEPFLGLSGGGQNGLFLGPFEGSENEVFLGLFYRCNDCMFNVLHTLNTYGDDSVVLYKRKRSWSSIFEPTEWAVLEAFFGAPKTMG